MSESWFTADTHFCHANIIRHCNRPFDNVQEMDEALITNWNQLVAPSDLVYHLGDVFWWRAPVKKIEKIFNQLNGHKHLVLGNHDRRQNMELLRWSWINDVYDLRIGGGQTIWLSHYAHRSWNRSFHGAWHLYGHTHSRLHPYGLSFDVGVDSWNYEPVNLGTVRDLMDKLKAELKAYPHRPLWDGRETLKP